MKRKIWQGCEDPNISNWVTPPRYADAEVLVSYAGADHGVILRRVWDQRSGGIRYSQRLLGPREIFSPWEKEPE